MDEHRERHAERRSVELPRLTLHYTLAPHDAALALSSALEVKADCQLTAAWLIDAMQAMARDVEEQGGVVGHIKCAAQSDDAEMHASVTLADTPATVKGDSSLVLDEFADVNLVVIALCIDEAALEGLVQKELS